MYKRILVPLDGSALAEQALSQAVAQAACFGAEITLLKVLSPLPDALITAPSAVRAAEEQSGELARSYLEEIATGIRERGISVQVATCEGKPYLEIIRFSEESQADLIVMSARGHSGFSRWLLGSVADRVVRGATVPILLVQCAAEDQKDGTGKS